jgi:hypothetical protein
MGNRMVPPTWQNNGCAAGFLLPHEQKMARKPTTASTGTKRPFFVDNFN